jgi:hypothetical protein
LGIDPIARLSLFYLCLLVLLVDRFRRRSGGYHG